jgi:single-strand DNA-binding protein
MNTGITKNNFVQLIGRLGKDPEIRTNEKGKKMARFTLATNESYTNAKGEKIENVTWHNITAWGNLADKIEVEFKKGTLVTLQAKLINNSYEDKNGKQVKAVNIVAQEMKLFEKKNTSNHENQGAETSPF